MGWPGGAQWLGVPVEYFVDLPLSAKDGILRYVKYGMTPLNATGPIFAGFDGLTGTWKNVGGAIEYALKAAVATKANLPINGNDLNDAREVSDEGYYYLCIDPLDGAPIDDQWIKWRVVSAVVGTDSIPNESSIPELNATGALNHLYVRPNDEAAYWWNAAGLAVVEAIKVNAADEVELATVSNINFGTTAPAHAEGTMWYDSGSHTLTFYNDKSDTAMNIGQETWVRVHNTSGAQIDNGQAVFVSGTPGSPPKVDLASCDQLDAAAVVGLATHDIPNGQEGWVVTFGLVHDVDTSAWDVGDRLYLGEDGALVNAPPVYPNMVQPIGVVTTKDASTGVVLVDPNAAFGFYRSKQEYRADATTLAPGDTQAVVMVTADTDGSTGGDIIAFQAAVTDGGASVWAMQAMSDVNPIRHRASSIDAITSAFTYHASYTDVTAAFAGGTNVNIFADDNDYVYIGHDVVFGQIIALLATAAEKNIRPTFEYWNGAAWTTFNPADGTLGFSQDGVISWSSPDLAGWATTTVNGSGPYYWIRIQRTRNHAGAGTCVESSIKVGACTHIYSWDKDGKVTVAELVAPEISARPPSTYFVSKAGSDVTGDGSIARPFLTIAAAVAAGNASAAAYVVVVGPGTFAEDIKASEITQDCVVHGAGVDLTTLSTLTPLTLDSSLFDLTVEDMTLNHTGAGEQYDCVTISGTRATRQIVRRCSILVSDSDEWPVQARDADIDGGSPVTFEDSYILSVSSGARPVLIKGTANNPSVVFDRCVVDTAIQVEHGTVQARFCNILAPDASATFAVRVDADGSAFIVNSLVTMNADSALRAAVTVSAGGQCIISNSTVYVDPSSATKQISVAAGAVLFMEGSALQESKCSIDPAAIVAGYNDIVKSELGTTVSEAYSAVNNTAAALGAQQVSPSTMWSGNGWATSGSVSKRVDMRAYNLPVQGTTNPSGQLTFEARVDGGAWAEMARLTSGGSLRTVASIYSGLTGAGIFYGTSLLPLSTGNLLSLYGYETDGAAAVGVKIGNKNDLTTAGAKVAAFYRDQGTIEVAHITKNGGVGQFVNAAYGGGELRAVATTQTSDAADNVAWTSPALADNTSMEITVKATALETDGSDRASFELKALFYRNGGNVSQEGITTAVSVIRSDANWDCDFSLDTVNQEVDVIVNGNGDTVNWKLRVEYVVTTGA